MAHIWQTNPLLERSVHFVSWSKVLKAKSTKRGQIPKSHRPQRLIKVNRIVANSSFLYKLLPYFCLTSTRRAHLVVVGGRN